MTRKYTPRRAMCVHLANSPETYKGMARDALRALDAALEKK